MIPSRLEALADELLYLSPFKACLDTPWNSMGRLAVSFRFESQGVQTSRSDYLPTYTTL